MQNFAAAFARRLPPRALRDKSHGEETTHASPALVGTSRMLANDPSPMRFIAYVHAADARSIDGQESIIRSHLSEGDELLEVYVDVNRPKRFTAATLRAAAVDARDNDAVLLLSGVPRLLLELSFIRELVGVRFMALDDLLVSPAALPVLLRQAEARQERSKQVRSTLSRVKAELAALTPDQVEARLKSGKAVKLGGAPLTDAGRENSAASRRALSVARRKVIVAEIKALVRSGIVNNNAIADHLNEKGVLRPRGGLWTGVYVSRFTSKLQSRT